MKNVDKVTDMRNRHLFFKNFCTGFVNKKKVKYLKLL